MRCSIVSLPAKLPTDRVLTIDFYAAALGEAATREACENLTKPNIKAAVVAAARAGYSENGARQIVYNLLTKVYILDAIVANLAERATVQRPLGKLLTSY